MRKKDLKKLCEMLKHSEKHIINEAMDNDFKFSVLKQLRSFSEKVRYCRQHLGNPIGNGSSRMVFQIDDQWVLKLAKNAKGVAQNEVEGRSDWYRDSLDMFPKVEDNVSDTENWMFLVSEYVLPCKKEDFKQVLGVPFEIFCRFLFSCERCYNPRIPSWWCLNDEEFGKLQDESEYFSQLYSYLADYTVPVGDYTRLANLGMVMRDGEPRIVFLDSGFNDDVAKMYRK